jgi:hypothetical protein
MSFTKFYVKNFREIDKKESEKSQKLRWRVSPDFSFFSYCLEAIHIFKLFSKIHHISEFWKLLPGSDHMQRVSTQRKNDGHHAPSNFLLFHFDFWNPTKYGYKIRHPEFFNFCRPATHQRFNLLKASNPKIFGGPFLLLPHRSYTTVSVLYKLWAQSRNRKWSIWKSISHRKFKILLIDANKCSLSLENSLEVPKFVETFDRKPINSLIPSQNSIQTRVNSIEKLDRFRITLGLQNLHNEFLI